MQRAFGVHFTDIEDRAIFVGTSKHFRFACVASCDASVFLKNRRGNFY